MQNLQSIEDIYNAHADAYDRAFFNNKDFLIEHEEGFLNGMEEVLNQLGVNYKIDTFGRITIKQEAES